MKSVPKQLAEIYYTPKHPASFSNVKKLRAATGKKISKKAITDWLIGQNTYTRHKPIRKKFPRNCYILNNIDQLWESDLIVFPTAYNEHNDGVRYILGKFLTYTGNIFFCFNIPFSGD